MKFSVLAFVTAVSADLCTITGDTGPTRSCPTSKSYYYGPSFKKADQIYSNCYIVNKNGETYYAISDATYGAVWLRSKYTKNCTGGNPCGGEICPAGTVP